MKRRGDAKSGERKTVGYGYVGRWGDGTVGWAMPRHLSGSTRFAEPPVQQDWTRGETAVLCRVTVEVVRDKRGREIRRKFPAD